MIKEHEIYYDEEKKAWIQPMDKKYLAESWRCCHCKEMPVRMYLKISKENSIYEHEYYKPVGVDNCISEIVKALNDGGIETVACCCSHKRGCGNIVLADGRELFIIDTFEKARELEKLINNII